MGAHSSLIIVAADSPKWVPDQEFMKDVVRLLGTTRVQYVSGYPFPLYWDYPIEKLSQQTFWIEAVDIDTAFRVLEERKPVYASIGLLGHGYIDRIFDSLATIPESVAGSLVLGDVSLSIGPFSIPSYDLERTIGRFSFALCLTGSGMPYEPDPYLRAVRDNPEMKNLLSQLHERSPKRWDVLISASY